MGRLYQSLRTVYQVHHVLNHCAAALDKLAPVVGIDLPINVALVWTALLILYEIGSILENAHAFGLKIAWLQK